MIVAEPARPYSLERTVGAFARFPDESVDIVVPGGYRRAFQNDGTITLCEARQTGPEYDSPVGLRVVASSRPNEAFGNEALGDLRRIISVDERVDALYELLTDHPRLSVLHANLHGMRRTLDPSPFEGLVSSIIAQLISIRGAATVRARLVRRCGRTIEFDGHEYWTFPHAEQVVGSSVDELCGLKMTSAKARAILTVARAAVAGELDREQLERHSDSELIGHLTSMPGIGPWTAEWFLVNVMGRMSVVPAGDLGIRRSTGHWLLGAEMPSSQEVRAAYEPFGELRAYVAYYVLSAERYHLSPPADHLQGGIA